MWAVNVCQHDGHQYPAQESHEDSPEELRLHPGAKSARFRKVGPKFTRVLCITVATWGLPSNRQIDLVLSCANVSSCFAVSTLKMERVRGGVLWTGQRPPQPVWSSKISPKGGRVSCTDPTATSRCLRNPCPGIRRSLAKGENLILTFCR
jgi:hypothetical protein